MKKHIFKVFFACLGLLVLILDSKHAIAGAQEGLELCIQVVIPSLFPFLFLSGILLTAIKDECIASNKPLRTANLLLIGYLGGYPIGAQCVAQAYTAGQLSKENAQKLVICCNNPGPAFIFGITAVLFPSKWYPLLLWGIHILSSLLLLRVLPQGADISGSRYIPPHREKTSSLPEAIQSMAFISGWIILFRIVIQILNHSLFRIIPQRYAILLYGFMELTNGCATLPEIGSVGLKFALCAMFLRFGGLCTALQTRSVAKSVNCRKYIPAKISEGLTSFLLAYILQLCIIPQEYRYHAPAMLLAALLAINILTVFFLRKSKNNSRILSMVGV